MTICTKVWRWHLETQEDLMFQFKSEGTKTENTNWCPRWKAARQEDFLLALCFFEVPSLLEKVYRIRRDNMLYHVQWIKYWSHLEKPSRNNTEYSVWLFIWAPCGSVKMILGKIGCVQSGVVIGKLLLLKLSQWKFSSSLEMAAEKASGIIGRKELETLDLRALTSNS